MSHIDPATLNNALNVVRTVHQQATVGEELAYPDHATIVALCILMTAAYENVKDLGDLLVLEAKRLEAEGGD